MSQSAAPAAERLRSLADADVAAAATAGEPAAFEELYRRNVTAAWRVAHAVAGNPEDAADAVADAFERVFRAVAAGRLAGTHAFRPYLLTATRRAAMDISRRSGRTAPIDEMDELGGIAPAAGPHDRMVADLDAALLGQAFRQLPERWRTVLWLLEVERLSADEAGKVLALRPNTVAQLAVRARMGLRKRFLVAHVSDGARPECTVVVERLSAYAEGALSHRRAARIDLHLHGCAACRRRREEIQDLGLTLRRSALPVPVGLAAAAAGGWRSLFGGRPSGQHWMDSVRQLPARLPGFQSTMTWASGATTDVSASASAVDRVVSWATAGVLVLGVSVGVARTGITGPGYQASPPGAAGSTGPAGSVRPEIPTVTGGGGGGALVPAGIMGPPLPEPGAAVPSPVFNLSGGEDAAPIGATHGGEPVPPSLRASPNPVDAVTGVVPSVAPAVGSAPIGGVVDGVVKPVTGGAPPPPLPVLPRPSTPVTPRPSGGSASPPPAANSPVPQLGTPAELPVPPVTVPGLAEGDDTVGRIIP